MATRLRLSEAENLAETLDVGNFTTDGQQIEAQNGSAFLNLRYTNKDNYAFLGNSNGNLLIDNGVSLLEYLIAGIGFRLSVGESAITLVGVNQDSYISTAENLLQQRGLSNFANGSNNNLLIIDVTAADRETSSFQTLGFFINTGNGVNSSIIKQNVQNSVIVGGQGITAKTNDTLYTNQISLQESGVLFDTILKSSTATADRTATLQDASGTVAYLSDITSTSNGLYAQTVNSATSTTAPEQSIVGTGVGTLTVPPNSFIVGDSYHGKIGGIINATGGGGRSEIIIRIKTGATILASTGIFDLDTATNQGWECEIDFTIATIGAGGTICTNGNFAYVKDGDRKVSGYVFQDLQPIDTTIINTLDITAEWQVINAGDSIYSANFVLYKVY